MEQAFVKLLDENLECTGYKLKNDKTILLAKSARKMFCLNKDCSHKTFSKRFDFISSNGKKTKRLIDKILITSTKLSSVTASAICSKNAHYCG